MPRWFNLLKAMSTRNLSTIEGLNFMSSLPCSKFYSIITLYRVPTAMMLIPPKLLSAQQVTIASLEPSSVLSTPVHQGHTTQILGEPPLKVV
jgi:hypothetical protein